MRRYIDLDEAIKAIIRVGAAHAVDSDYEDAHQILGEAAADMIFELQHLDRKEMNE